MIYTKSEIEHIAAEMCQQDWNDLRFQDVYYRAFIEGASYFNSIPDGYALVHVEPTDAMIEAMSASLAYSSPSTTWAEDAKKAYKAMIADAQFPKGSVVDDNA